MDKDDLEKTKEINTITDISDEKLESVNEDIVDDSTLVGDDKALEEEAIINDQEVDADKNKRLIFMYQFVYWKKVVDIYDIGSI